MRLSLSAGVLTVALIFLSGCTGSGGTPAQGTDTVAIKNFAFDPQTLTVKAGTTVTWTNEDAVAHNIRSDTFNSQELGKGDTFKSKFDTPGTYEYSCGIHQSMKGTIIVQ